MDADMGPQTEITVTDVDIANLRSLCSMVLGAREPTAFTPAWRSEAGRLYEMLGEARDAANPNGSKVIEHFPTIA